MCSERYPDDQSPDFGLDAHDVALVLVDFGEGLVDEIFLQLVALTPSFLFVGLDLIVITFAMSLVIAHFLALAHVVHPICQVHQVVGKVRVFADFFELLVVFQLQQIMVLLFRQVFEVYVGQPSDEILPVVVKESQVLELFPFKFGFWLIV